MASANSLRSLVKLDIAGSSFNVATLQLRCLCAYLWSAVGHDLTVIGSPKPSLKGPDDCETCWTIYGRTSATAVVEGSVVVGPVLCGLLSNYPNNESFPLKKPFEQLPDQEKRQDAPIQLMMEPRMQGWELLSLITALRMFSS